MTLPRVQPYPMPTDTFTDRAGWQPSRHRAALLIHDMQNYFVDAFQRDAEPVPDLLANITALANRCRQAGVPVIYSAQPGGQTPEQRGLLQDIWGPGVGTDPTEAEIVDKLAPDEHDVVVRKWRYSAFVRTRLADVLREHRRTQLIVCGVYAHIGCLMTAAEAFNNDIQPFLPSDGVADFSLDHHRAALAYAAARCAVVTTTSRLCESL